MNTLLFATYNQNKIKEFNDLIKNMDFPINVVTSEDIDNAPIVVEKGSNYVENALAKAHRLAEISNLPTLVDCSGLMVDKLNGAPGRFANRYAGELYNDARNNAKLLAALGGVPKEKRTATLHTTLVLSWPGHYKRDLITQGELEGRILSFPNGENNYGYDPLFYVDEVGKTLGQLTLQEKNKISHRSQAMRKMLNVFPKWWQEMVQLEMAHV